MISLVEALNWKIMLVRKVSLVPMFRRFEPGADVDNNVLILVGSVVVGSVVELVVVVVVVGSVASVNGDSVVVVVVDVMRGFVDPNFVGEFIIDENNKVVDSIDELTGKRGDVVDVVIVSCSVVVEFSVVFVNCIGATVCFVVGESVVVDIVVVAIAVGDIDDCIVVIFVELTRLVVVVGVFVFASEDVSSVVVIAVVCITLADVVVVSAIVVVVGVSVEINVDVVK
jgi:hypothetical protein